MLALKIEPQILSNLFVDYHPMDYFSFRIDSIIHIYILFRHYAEGICYGNRH